MLQSVLSGFIFAPPFQRNCPVNLTSVLAPEAVDTIRRHFEALNFVTSEDKISVLNSPSNVDSEYVYFV